MTAQTGSFLNSSILLGDEFLVLQTALDQTYDLLNQVSLSAALPDYWVTAFGTGFNGATAEAITLQWQNQDFSQFPAVEVLSPQEMQGAIAAYGQATNTIYLSAALVKQGSVAEIREVLLEEYGHFLDTQVNGTDSPGDEGAIWRNLLLGQPMDQDLLATLRQENDWGSVTVNGQTVAVERALIVLTVNTEFDDNDGSASLGTGLSLRDAIIIANNNTQNEYIIDLASGGNYFLTQSGSANSGEDDFVYDLDIFSNTKVTIRTLGSTPATINATTLLGDGQRIFEVFSGGTLTLNKVVVTGGRTTGQGGGISNSGTLNLYQTTVKNNSANDDGGGISNSGTLNIVQSTINNNLANDDGGGVYNTGTMTISNSTISSNMANYRGGGLYTSGNSLLINATVTNNTADADNNNSSGHGGGIYSSGSNLSLRNTIVAGNFDNPGSAGTGTKHPDISGSVQGNAYNLIGDLTGASGTIGTGTDLRGAPANLGPLAFNGGPTQIHALLSGSAAINAGSTVLSGTDLGDSDGDGIIGEPIPFDQRGLGFSRVSGSSVDIGAFEFSPSLVVNDPSVTEGNSGNTNLTFTVSLTAPLSQTVTVSYGTANGTATAGSDYIPTSGILSFAPGETSKAVNVTVIGDTVVEQNETVLLNLTSAANAPISDGQGQGTILNDDTFLDDLTTPLFRLRNSNLPGTYLFAGEQEALSIAQNPAYRNFVNEGFAFAVASSQTDPLLRPFYRFANTAPGREGTYLFVGEQEKNYISQNIPTYRLDGVAFYALDAGAGGGSINFSRFQNLGIPGTYLFAGPSETAALASNPNFRLEGLAFAAGG